MLKNIYMVVRKGFTGHFLVDSYDDLMDQVEEGDFVYEVREAMVAIRDKVRLESFNQDTFDLDQHNYN